MNVGILAVDYYLPVTRVSTADMLDEIKPERFGVTNKYVEESAGIKEVRHIHNELPSKMAIEASLKAIERASISPDDIGVIIFCGIDRDYNEPATAHNVQAGIGSQAFCFDVQNACLGFASALLEAEMWVRSRRAKYALVCTGERSSLVSKDWIDTIKRSDDVNVFKKHVGGLTVGDAGAAAIVGPTESEAGFKGFQFASEGEHAQLCYYSMESGKRHGEMVMGKISAVMLRAQKRLYSDSLHVLGWQPSDMDIVITHQVGQRTWERFAQILGIQFDKLTKTFENLGNITSATFPVNLAIGLEEKKISKGMKVFGALAGSGLSIVQMGMQI